MDITVEICEAALPGRDFPNTLILRDRQLEQLARYAKLVPSREINWEQTFARKGLCHADYELALEDYPHYFRFERRADANKSLPAKVSLNGREQSAYSDDTVQGELLTYLVEEPVLSFKICRTLELAVNYRVNEEFPDGVKTLIGDYAAAVDFAQHVRGKGAAERFAQQLTQCWDSASSFLQVEPSDIPF
jgi:hypothetical protein